MQRERKPSYRLGISGLLSQRASRSQDGGGGIKNFFFNLAKSHEKKISKFFFSKKRFFFFFDRCFREMGPWCVCNKNSLSKKNFHLFHITDIFPK